MYWYQWKDWEFCKISFWEHKMTGSHLISFCLNSIKKLESFIELVSKLNSRQVFYGFFKFSHQSNNAGQKRLKFTILVLVRISTKFSKYHARKIKQDNDDWNFPILPLASSACCPGADFVRILMTSSKYHPRFLKKKLSYDNLNKSKFMTDLISNMGACQCRNNNRELACSQLPKKLRA